MVGAEENLFVGVDVGTGSARAALVTEDGKVLKTAVKPIQTWNPQADHFEQSSDDIWNACIFVIKTVTEHYPPESIKGIGFDATCSLVVLSENCEPITASLTGEPNQNIILWMDHRAKNEAEFINEKGHDILKYVGGKVSLEMQMPKLLWLKRNLPTTWTKAGAFFDLPDYLTWKATGSKSRSLCSLVCKWNYEVTDPHNMGWNKSYLEQIDLAELSVDDFRKIGNTVLLPGATCGTGLSKTCAMELGLNEGTPVGTSIIDAHAGGLGIFGTHSEKISDDFETRIALICGTSTCHMAINKSPTFASGIWGPYYGAMIPNYWLNEAGQSASGILIEHIINSHPASVLIKKKIDGKMIAQDYLHALVDKLTVNNKYDDCCYLTKDIHVWPDFHGNRSPLADPNLRGMISGLTLSCDEENLAVTYLAVLQALSYGTRHILEHLQQAGYKKFDSLLICGGLAKNKLFVQIQSDTIGIPILCPGEPESVLVGAAILGACGAKYFPDVGTAVHEMSGDADVVWPKEAVRGFHEKKYRVFLKMVDDQRVYQNIMKNV